MAKILLRRRKKETYKITGNYNSKYPSMRVNLHPMCGFNIGDEVYQVKRDDGVIELIPEKVFIAKNMHLQVQ